MTDMFVGNLVFRGGIMNLVKTFLILTAGVGILPSCGINTGLDPIDNVLSPRKTYTQDFRFINNSSESLSFDGSLYQAIDDARCESYKDESKKEVAPGQASDAHLSLKCRQHTLNQTVVVTRHGNFATGMVYLGSQSNIDKLHVGTQFKVMSSDKAQSVDITLVANTYVPDSGNTTYWPTPSTLAAGVAWISGMTLTVAIPLSFAASTDIAFPKALGISDFGNSLVRDEGGYFVSSMDFYEGISVYPGIVGENSEVSCDSIGCTARAF
jgi:hypothetical protein